MILGRGIGFTNGFQTFESKHNSIKDNDIVKFLLAYVKKMQNIAKVKILASNKTAPSTKAAIGRKGLNVNIENLYYTIS